MVGDSLHVYSKFSVKSNMQNTPVFVLKSRLFIYIYLGGNYPPVPTSFSSTKAIPRTSVKYPLNKNKGKRWHSTADQQKLLVR